MRRPRALKNMGASVRMRLTEKARSRGENVQLLLTRFAIERLIYRLAQSPYRDEFVLKGAMLFSLWAPVPYRSTGDLDLLGQGNPAPERLAKVFQDICALDLPDEGVTFDPESAVVEPTRVEDEYQGIRVTLMATIADAKLPIQIDIGFGDVVTPGTQDINYPSLLDLPEANLKAYPPETVVAEKLEAIVSLGMGNTRMKDFFDLWAIAKTFAFKGEVLSRAIGATFERRRTQLPAEAPIALTATFADDPEKQTQWSAFIRRTEISLAPEPLPEIIALISTFAAPPITAAAEDKPLLAKWPAGGPWG